MEANLQLLDDVKCATLMTTDSSFPPVRKIISERAVTVVELPSLEKLFAEDVDYPYDKDPSTAAKGTAFMVHSSGSTGKVAYYTSRLLLIQHKAFPNRCTSPMAILHVQYET